MNKNLRRELSRTWITLGACPNTPKTETSLQRVHNRNGQFTAHESTVKALLGIRCLKYDSGEN